MTYVCDVYRRGGHCAHIVPKESARRVLNVGLIHDRIASIDGLGLVSAVFPSTTSAPLTLNA
jgi:hypothetical protein